MIDSSFLLCNGIDLTFSLGFRETMNRLESISISYNHKKTSVICRPSLFHTYEYILSMVNKIPSKKTMSKSKKSFALENVTSLLTDTSIKLDFHIEEIVLAILTSSFVNTSTAELSIQSISLSYLPSARSNTDYYSSINEFHFKIGAVELKLMSTSKEMLMKLTQQVDEAKSAEHVKIPPCNEKIISFCNLELNSVLTKFERISVDCISKSSNIALSYSSLEIVIYLLEFYMGLYSDFKERRKEVLSKIPSSCSVSSLSEPVTQEAPKESEEPVVSAELKQSPSVDMDNDDVFIQSIMNNTLIPNGFDKLLSLNEIVMSDEAFTPPSSPVIPSASPVNPSTPPKITSNPLTPPTPTPISSTPITPNTSNSSLGNTIQLSDDTSSVDTNEDEIFLSEEENAINSTAISPSYRFIPIFLTDFSIHLYSMELQVSGVDSTKSTSYSVESITFTLNSKSLDSFDRSDEPSVVFSRFNDPLPPNLPVYTPDQLSVIAEGSSRLQSQSLDDGDIDIDKIPNHIDNMDKPLLSLPTLPVRPVRRTSRPLTSVLPLNQYQRNSGVEYTITIELSNITVMGDEGSSAQREQLPLYIPQIKCTLPPFVFVAISSNQIPSSLNEISIRYKSFVYLPHCIGKYHGIKRGEESLFFLSSSNPSCNTLDVNISNLFVRLAYGSIYVIYHSFVDLISLFKRSQLFANLPEKKPKSNSSSTPLVDISHYQFILGISHCNIMFTFTEKEGLLAYIDNIVASYPDTTECPLLSISALSLSLVQSFCVVSSLLSVDRIEVFSPSLYEAVCITRRLNDFDCRIDEIRKEVLSTKPGDENRFVSCPTCLKHPISDHQCNGYDNQCNKHTNHIPPGVKPFVVTAGQVDCSQDSTYSWGDLIYDATTQWKAFKTIRKGPKKPPAYPSADATLVKEVGNHEEIDDSTILNGYWVELCINELFLQLNDIIPEISPQLMDYSKVEVVGVNAVLTYNKILHSRSHFLKFMESMDEITPPFDKGFDDVLGLHIHDLYVESACVDFGEFLPPMAVASSVFGCGTLVFTEMNRVEKYTRKEVVELYCSHTFDSIPVEITRSAIPSKFFTNLSVQAKQLEVNWGDPHSTFRRSLIHSFGVLTPKGVGRSPKLPWYDKMRFAMHGEMNLHVSDLFRVNWMTDKQQDKQFESLTIDFVDVDVDCYKQGGFKIAFEKFSIGVSQFKEIELQLKPLIIVDNSEWHINLLWGNKDTKNHYVELNDAVDDTDRYMYYRSHYIEWNVDLVPTSNLKFATTVYLRMEMIGFLLDFWNMVKRPSNHIDKDPNLMRNATVFNVNMSLDNMLMWVFLNNESENGFSLQAKNTSLLVTMYKLLPKYFTSLGKQDRMAHSSKPDYSDLTYSYELFQENKWTFPKYLVKMKQAVLNYVYLIRPQEPDSVILHPFLNRQFSSMLVGRIGSMGIVKGLNDSSELDDDLSEIYNEKIKSNNLKFLERSESKCAVLMNGLKVIYSLDVRDAIMMTIHDYSPVFSQLSTDKKKTTPVDTSPVETSPVRPVLPEVVVAPRQPLQRQQSIVRGLSESRRDSAITSSITRSFSGTSPLYRSESSCFITHLPSNESIRMSISGSLNRHRLDILRSSNTSIYRQASNADSQRLLTRLNSSNGFRPGNDMSFQLRRQQKDRLYEEMKNKEKEAARQKGKEDPQLLTYLLRKAAHVNVKKEQGVMIVSDQDVMVKKDDKKDDKDDFLYGIFLTDSQVFMPSVETGSSLLLYLYQGTMIVQSKKIQQRDYSVINSRLSKVDLFLGTRDSQLHPWISPKSLSLHSCKHYKRIIQDFSLSLLTRSQNGFLPSFTTNDPGFRRDDLVNRVTVNIGAFSVRMTSEEFYRFLNVIQFTLLVNPTSSPDTSSKENLDVPVTNSNDVLQVIENKVLSLLGTTNEMIPVLKIKYTLEEVEWSLMSNNQTEIAVATLKGLTGDHTFCYDSKSENKITLNDLRITNPSYSVKEQYWAAPDVIIDPVPLDRDKDEQSNMLEIIAVISNQCTCEGVRVQVFEHVGINVYPGSQYYILFQLTGEVATTIFRYFFPDDDDEASLSVTSPTSEVSPQGFDEEDLSVKSPTPSDVFEDIRLDSSEDDLSQITEDSSVSLKGRKNTITSDSMSVSSGSKRFRFKKLNNGCNHEFEVVDLLGNCAICKKKIGTARYVAYRCSLCGVMICNSCKKKSLERSQKRKEKSIRRLVFFEHFRIGTVEMIISTKGMSPLNLNNFNITLQHQIYSNKLTEWSKCFKMIKKAYTSELLRSAPSFMLRGWGFKETSHVNEIKDKKKQENEDDQSEVLSDDKKISLLLGI